MSPHQILGVAESATRQQIDVAWRKLALRHHPDRNLGDEDAAVRLNAVNEAYAALVGKTVVVDPVEKLALTLLSNATCQTISGILQRGGSPAREDVIVAIKEELRKALVKGRELLRGQEAGLLEIKTLLGRFSGASAAFLEDVVGGAILENSRQQKERTVLELKALERAVEMLSGTKFRADAPARGMFAVTGGRVTSTGSWTWGS
jgi:hypothetical protein